MFVVDASVALSWLMPDEETFESLQLFEKVKNTTLFVPAHFHAEILNILTLSTRKGRLKNEVRLIASEILKNLNFEIDKSESLKLFEPTFALAQKHTLSYYDALYLELALRKKLELATFDKALARAYTVELQK